MSNPSKTGSRSPGPPALPRHALEALEGAGLADLVERARWLEALDRLLRQSLPAPLAEHCRLANVDRNRVVFLASAPAWKSALRLHADAVLGAAAAAGLEARTLVVKVSPPAPIPNREGGRAGPLSEAVREALRTTARSVEDPGLRAQLLKLADASRPSTDDA